MGKASVWRLQATFFRAVPNQPNHPLSFPRPRLQQGHYCHIRAPCLPLSLFFYLFLHFLQLRPPHQQRHSFWCERKRVDHHHCATVRKPRSAFGPVSQSRQSEGEFLRRCIGFRRLQRAFSQQQQQCPAPETRPATPTPFTTPVLCLQCHPLQHCHPSHVCSAHCEVSNTSKTGNRCTPQLAGAHCFPDFPLTPTHARSLPESTPLQITAFAQQHRA